MEIMERNCSSFPAFTCAILFVLAGGRAAAATTQNFDGGGTSYQIGNYQASPAGPSAPGVTSGGPNGNFFRLTDNTVSSGVGSRTAIAFPLTDSGARPKLNAFFDFNLNSAVNGGGDGFSFIVL